MWLPCFQHHPGFSHSEKGSKLVGRKRQRSGTPADLRACLFSPPLGKGRRDLIWSPSPSMVKPRCPAPLLPCHRTLECGPYPATRDLFAAWNFHTFPPHVNIKKARLPSLTLITFKIPMFSGWVFLLMSPQQGRSQRMLIKGAVWYRDLPRYIPNLGQCTDKCGVAILCPPCYQHVSGALSECPFLTGTQPSQIRLTRNERMVHRRQDQNGT